MKPFLVTEGKRSHLKQFKGKKKCGGYQRWGIRFRGISSKDSKGRVSWDPMQGYADTEKESGAQVTSHTHIWLSCCLSLLPSSLSLSPQTSFLFLCLCALISPYAPQQDIHHIPVQLPSRDWAVTLRANGKFQSESDPPCLRCPLLFQSAATKNRAQRT